MSLGAGFLGARLAVLDRIQEAVSIGELLARGDYRAVLKERYSAVRVAGAAAAARCCGVCAITPTRPRCISR